MKKGPIIAISVGVLIILAVVVGVGYSNKKEGTKSAAKGADRVCTVKGDVYDSSDDTNPAAHIGANETRLTCETFKDNVDLYKGVVVVDMYLPGCSHCQAMGPILSEVADETVGKYKVAKIDVAKYPEIGTEYSVESVPAFIFYKDGKEVSRLVGEKTKDEILTKLKEASEK